MERKFTIQQVSQMTNLSVHTLRYYERIGLLPKVNRSASGYREFSQDDLAWIEFLIRLRETGMPIHQVKTFADLRSKGSSTIRERQKLLEHHENEVKKQIAMLQQNLSAIREKISNYNFLGGGQSDGMQK